MTLRNKETFSLVTAFILSGVLWFGLLGYRDLVDPDEGRYAQIPAAMESTGDWLTPRLNDFKYFEKPVLQYWATAVIYKLLGKNNATARLWTALTGFALALVAAIIAFRLHGRNAAIFAYLITISSMMFVVFGHLLTLDMALSAFMVTGIGSLVIAQHGDVSKAWTRNWMLLAWSALALGTLTKGPVAVVLPAGAVVLYSIWQRDITLWKRLHLFKGLLLFLLITSPWFIAVSMANSEFAEFFFIHEHFDRYTSQVHKRDGPVYFFVPYLLLGLSPWLIISLKSLLTPGFKWRPDNPGEFDAHRFLWTFAVFTFVFFSLGQSKLPGYILPMLPVLAVLSGAHLSRLEHVSADRWVMAALGITMLVAAFGIERLASDRYPLEQWQSYAPWLMASGLLFLLAAVGLTVLKKQPILAVATAAMLSLGALQLLVLGFNSLSETRSGRIVADVIAESVPAGTPVFSFGTLSESAAFYLESSFTLVEYTGELKMGIEQEPDKYISSFNEFVGKWQRLEQAVLIINSSTSKEYDLSVLAGKVVYKGPKRMVIIKS